MKKIQFEVLAKAGKLKTVRAHECAEGKYQLWAFPEGEAEWVKEFKTARGETRIWANLDVLLKFVKDMGYRGILEISPL